MSKRKSSVKESGDKNMLPTKRNVDMRKTEQSTKIPIPVLDAARLPSSLPRDNLNTKQCMQKKQKCKRKQCSITCSSWWGWPVPEHLLYRTLPLPGETSGKLCRLIILRHPSAPHLGPCCGRIRMFLNEVPGEVSRLIILTGSGDYLLVHDLSKNEPSNVPASITLRII